MRVGGLEAGGPEYGFIHGFNVSSLAIGYVFLNFKGFFDFRKSPAFLFAHPGVAQVLEIGADEDQLSPDRFVGLPLVVDESVLGFAIDSHYSSASPGQGH
jgi:hypothetical protein